MSRNHYLTRLFPLLLLIVFVLAPGLAAAGTDFCADIETLTKDGKTMPIGHLCIKGNKSRHEMTGEDGRKTIIIGRPDKGVAWTLMTRQKSYMEMPIDKLDKDEDLSVEWQDDYKMLQKNGKKVGSETVNGVKCYKYQLETGEGTVTYWVMKSTGLPVRIAADDGTVINYKNIKTGNLPDSLFEIPPGYHKFNLPNLGGMMQQMMKSLGGQGGGGLPLPAR